MRMSVELAFDSAARGHKTVEQAPATQGRSFVEPPDVGGYLGEKLRRLCEYRGQLLFPVRLFEEDSAKNGVICKGENPFFLGG